MGELLLGCSGWSYADPAEKGGWTGAFYPDFKTGRLAFYAEFFDTVEMDSTFYEKFYSHMTKGIFSIIYPRSQISTYEGKLHSLAHGL